MSDAIVKTVITICTVVITGFVIPFVKAKLADTKFNKIVAWTELLVRAAEQQVDAEGAGKQKYSLVASALSKMKGVHLTQDEIKTLIESAVYSVSKGADSE